VRNLTEDVWDNTDAESEAVWDNTDAESVASEDSMDVSYTGDEVKLRSPGKYYKNQVTGSESFTSQVFQVEMERSSSILCFAH
jgi:hypothetical protein